MQAGIHFNEAMIFSRTIRSASFFDCSSFECMVMVEGDLKSRSP